MTSARPVDQERFRYTEALQAACDQLRRVLASDPSVHRAILFGSYATGRRDLCTDLDVLVIMDSDRDFVTRMVELYRRLHLPVDLDLVAYTPDEWQGVADSPFIRRALTEGEVIYERDAA